MPLPNVEGEVAQWSVVTDADGEAKEKIFHGSDMRGALQHLRQYGNIKSSLESDKHYGIGMDKYDDPVYVLKVIRNKEILYDIESKKYFSESRKMKKDSSFKVIASHLYNGAVKTFKMPLEHVGLGSLKKRRLAKIVREEFLSAKEAADTEAKEVDGWHDAELEHEIDWVKSLSLKEFFKKKVNKPLQENFLLQMKNHFGADDIQIAKAVYWWLNHNHSGQGSEEYEALSSLAYRPGAMERGPEDDPETEEIYNSLDSDSAVALAQELKNSL